MPSIRELGHNPRTPARHGPQPRYGCGLVVDPFGQYAQIVDLRRTWHHPTPAPPDSTIPRVCTTAPTIPSRFQHNPPPKGRQTTKQSVPPAYGEAVTPAPRSVWPPAPILRKGEPARWPLRPTAAPRTEPPLRGRYPPLHKPSTAQAEAVKTDKANPSLPTARAGGDHR